jgi:hypothetical protein
MDDPKMDWRRWSRTERLTFVALSLGLLYAATALLVLGKG